MPTTYSPEKPLPQGSVLRGVLGALLGAGIGVIPYGIILVWQKPELENTSLWEALGMVAGYCACLGYRALKGRRSTVAGAVIVALSASLALICATLAAKLYGLGMGFCNAEAILIGLQNLLSPESRTGLIVGLLWGMLGVWSARPYLLWYTNPKRAAHKYGEAVLKEPVSYQDLPRSFTVRSKHRWISVGGLLCALLFGTLLAVAVIAFDPAEERGWLTLCICLCPLGIVGGIWSALRRWNCRLEVNGEYLRYISAVGKAREFYVRDIYGLGRSTLTGVYKLYDWEGLFLGWFDPTLENCTLLVQYLRGRGVGLGMELKT